MAIIGHSRDADDSRLVLRKRAHVAPFDDVPDHDGGIGGGGGGVCGCGRLRVEDEDLADWAGVAVESVFKGARSRLIQA